MSDEELIRPPTIDIQAKISSQQQKFEQLISDFKAQLTIQPREKSKVATEVEAFFAGKTEYDRRLSKMENQTLLHVEASAIFAKVVATDESGQENLRTLKPEELRLKLPSIVESSMLNKAVLRRLDTAPNDQKVAMIDSMSDRF